MIEVIAYRGQHGRKTGQLETRQAAVYFGDEVVAERYARNPNQRGDVPVEPHVFVAKVKLYRPFINNPNDPFLELSDVINQLGSFEAERIARKFASHIMQTNHWESTFSKMTGVEELLRRKPAALKDLYFPAYWFLSDRVEVEKLKAAGYDGAIHGGSGASALTTEYCVFDADKSTQVLSVSVI
jgi:hypothetical protein